MENDEVDNHEFYDAAEGDDDYGDVNKEPSSSSSTSNQKSDFDRPTMVKDADWRVYKIVSAAADEFNGKFKRMCIVYSR